MTINHRCMWVNAYSQQQKIFKIHMPESSRVWVPRWGSPPPCPAWSRSAPCRSPSAGGGTPAGLNNRSIEVTFITSFWDHLDVLVECVKNLEVFRINHQTGKLDNFLGLYFLSGFTLSFKIQHQKIFKFLCWAKIISLNIIFSYIGYNSNLS